MTQTIASNDMFLFLFDFLQPRVPQVAFFFPYLCGIDAKLNLSVMARWWMILASFLPNEGQKKTHREERIVCWEGDI